MNKNLPCYFDFFDIHYNGVKMESMASQIISLALVYSAVYSAADKKKHQSSASLAFVRGIHGGPVMFPFDDVIMHNAEIASQLQH